MVDEVLREAAGESGTVLAVVTFDDDTSCSMTCAEYAAIPPEYHVVDVHLERMPSMACAS